MLILKEETQVMDKAGDLEKNVYEVDITNELKEIVKQLLIISQKSRERKNCIYIAKFLDDWRI